MEHAPIAEYPQSPQRLGLSSIYRRRLDHGRWPRPHPSVARVGGGSGACGVATSNIAEWSGLVALLKATRSFGVERLSIHGDSQYVVCQFSRHYASHEPRTRRLAKEAHRVARTITVEIAWWPRAENGRADLLAHRLEPSKGHQPIAHGTHDYFVDTQRGTCTCPAFRFRQGPCKHLLAARAALHAEARGHR